MCRINVPFLQRCLSFAYKRRFGGGFLPISPFHAVETKHPTSKGACSGVGFWTRDAPPPDGGVWVWHWHLRTPGTLLIREHYTPHLLVGTSEFDRDSEREKECCKFQFAEGVVTDVWEISQRMTYLEYKDFSSVWLASELQVLLYSPLLLNPAYAVIISTLIYFEDLQTINLCLIPEKMNSYAKDPGQTSLLKMSKISVEPIGPNPTLLTHYLVVPTHPITLSSACRWWRPHTS